MDLDVTSLLEAALQQGIWAALYISSKMRCIRLSLIR